MFNGKRVSTVVILFFVVLMGINLMMFGFSTDAIARNLGQIIGAILFGYMLYGIVYLIFLRKKRLFSHNAAWIIACFLLLNSIVVNFAIPLLVR